MNTKTKKYYLYLKLMVYGVGEKYFCIDFSNSAHRCWPFWTDGWNVFDFVVVLATLIASGPFEIPGNSTSQPLNLSLHLSTCLYIYVYVYMYICICINSLSVAKRPLLVQPLF